MIFIPIVRSRTTSPHDPRRRVAGLALLLLAGLLVALTGCGAGGGDGSGRRPRVVVTTAVLGALVRDVAGPGIEVDVLMPDGVDPHDFQPSARDADRLRGADLVVTNGAGLEGGIEDALQRVRDDGGAVFTVADHVPVRPGATGDEMSGTDPHVWLDPLLMARMVAALAPELSRRTGVDVSARAAREERSLRALDRRLRAEAARVPPADRLLVAGHDSLGYFARRYGFSVAGALVPSLSSQAEPSARQLAELVALIRARRVRAVFTEVGTPAPVARAVGEEAGVPVVDVPTHTLPDGTYAGLMRRLMDGVVGALAPA